MFSGLFCFQVLSANPARLSSLDYIDMDVERLVQSPPPRTPPALVQPVNASTPCTPSAGSGTATFGGALEAIAVEHRNHANHNHHNHLNNHNHRVHSDGTPAAPHS